jgi:amino acid transporter
VVIKLGSCTTKWNIGLSSGYWTFFYTIVFFGLGYLMIALCVSEMMSVHCFESHFYGFSRILLGPTAGYVIAVSAFLESLFYMSIFPLKIAEMFLIAFPDSAPYLYLTWFLLYIALIVSYCSFVHYKFWPSVWLSFLFMLTIYFIYLFGSIHQGLLDFDKWAVVNHGEKTSQRVQLNTTPVSILFFMGFDWMTIMSNEVKNVSDCSFLLLSGRNSDFLLLSFCLSFFLLLYLSISSFFSHLFSSIPFNSRRK